MLTGLIGIIVLDGLVVGQLLWRLKQDRLFDRAQGIRAQAHSALVKALGGESFVAVNVEPPTLMRAGRVVLSAPADWQWLLDPAWHGVLAHVPADYELVVKPVGPAPSPLLEALPLRRAA